MPRYLKPTKEEKHKMMVFGILLIIANVICLFPAAGFWSSKLMSWILGGDYWYDFVIKPWSHTSWGNFWLVILIATFPGLVTALNWIAFRKSGVKFGNWARYISAIMVMIGIIAWVKQW